MPHEQPWLDDIAARRQAELQASWDKDAKVFEIQNNVMKIIREECPFPLRTPAHCESCGNEACVKAFKEQQKLWPEELPVCHADTTSTNQVEAMSPAPLEQKNIQQFRHPGQCVSGSRGLFDYQDEEDEAA